MINYGYYDEDDDYYVDDKKSQSYSNTMSRLVTEEYMYRGNSHTRTRNKNYTVFSSDFIGGRIHHAKTGEFIGYVGKHDGDLFKVSMTIGIKTRHHSNPTHLYYYSPDEYERHHGVSLPLNVKEAWHKKQLQGVYESM